MSQLRRLLVSGLLSTLVVLAGGLVLLPVTARAASPAGAPAAPGSARTDGITNVLGDYDAEVRETAPRADGLTHVDTPATIAALQAAHVNTYAYLIWHSASDWSDLVNEFLPAAQQAQINVWVYLVPPSECCSQPYGADYVQWASAIATLSKQYPNLTAWVMDDFISNTTTFTGDYVGQMEDTAKAVNPALELFTIVYGGQYTSTFVTTYAPHVDGAIFPYTGDVYADLNNLGPLPGELDAAVNALKPLGKKLYLMPYASKLSVSPHPATAGTISSMLDLGLQYMREGNLDGIMLYATPLRPAVEQCQTPSFPHVLALRVPGGTPTPGGDSVQAGQQVTVDPNASSYSVSFYQSDSFKVYAADLGYYEKQLLVDGQVVWQRDVAADEADVWYPETVDLTSALQGRTSAALTFRLSNPRGVHNFAITVSLADVTGAGITIANGDFAAQDGWTFASTSTNFQAAYAGSDYICDPDRQSEVFDAVRSSYGPPSLVYRSLAATGVTGGQHQALVQLSSNALSQHEQGNDQSAAGMARALSQLARAIGLPVLADQAAAVAGELD